jgi:uncharacterized protein YcfL
MGMKSKGFSLHLNLFNTMHHIPLLAFLFLLSSCATYNKNPVTTLEEDQDGNIKVVAGSQQKLKSINVIRTFKETLNGKLLARAEVQNRSTRPKVFMYKFDWLNANGNIDTSTSIWKTVTINGQEVKTLEDVDIRGSAEDFRILLKSK